MGGLVETQLHNSLVALGDKDTAFAEEIIRDDNKIDALENSGVYIASSPAKLGDTMLKAMQNKNN